MSQRNGTAARRPGVDELASFTVDTVLHEAACAGVPVALTCAAIGKKLLATLKEQAGRDHAERDLLSGVAVEFGQKVRHRLAEGDHWSTIEGDIGLSRNILRSALAEDVR